MGIKQFPLLAWRCTVIHTGTDHQFLNQENSDSEV